LQEERPPYHEYVYSEALVALVKAANETVAFLEGFQVDEGMKFIKGSVMHLSGLYAAMLRTGDSEPVYESGNEPTVTEQDWSSLYQRVAMVLGPYNEFLRPAEEEEFDRSELIAQTVSEDLADIYQEIKDFTAIYSRGIEELMNDAAWELKSRFTEHWGKKLLRSLAQVHALYVRGVDPNAQ
jgi:hypothetical protein